MNSFETQQLNELDMLIKNTEFETSQQAKALVEERQKIETLQLQLNEFYSTIKDLQAAALDCEEIITKLNNQLIHHKESYKSLKGTSSVLDDHCEALRKKLDFTAQDTIDQRNAHLDAINKYKTVWMNYEGYYHNSVKAKEYLALKNELETLTSLRASLQDEIQMLEAKFSANAQMRSKRQLFSWIVEISSIKIKSLGNFKNIILLEESCSNHTKSINEKEQTIQSIRSRIHALQIERLKIQSEDYVLNESKTSKQHQYETPKISSSSQRCGLKLELPSVLRSTKPQQPVPVRTQSTRNVFTMNLNLPSSISRKSSKSSYVFNDAFLQKEPSQERLQTRPNPVSMTTENDSSLCPSIINDRGGCGGDGLVSEQQKDNEFNITTMLNITEKVQNEASFLIGTADCPESTSTAANTSVFDSNFTFEPSVLQHQPSLFEQENKSNGSNLFTQGDTSWFGPEESSNNVDMFSMFSGGPADVGNLFGGTSDRDHGEVFSLFGSPKGTTDQTEGFAVMNFNDVNTNNSSFSLFQ